MASPDDSAVAAHSATQSHHYVIHYPPHPARTSDPHYADFNAYHNKTRSTARCAIGEQIGFDDCRDAQGNACVIDANGQQSGLELHHSHIEFSLQNGVSLTALEKDYPGVSNPDEVGAWIETAANLLWLCLAPWSPVVMWNGMSKEISKIKIGDYVVGTDGFPDLVTAISKKPYQGNLIQLTNNLCLTPEHRIATEHGWLPARKVVDQLRMLGSKMFSVRGMQSQIFNPVISSNSINMMNALGWKQRSAEVVLHDLSVLHNEPLSVPNTNITSFLFDIGSPVSNIPLWKCIKIDEPAFVRTINSGTTNTTSKESSSADWAYMSRTESLKDITTFSASDSRRICRQSNLAINTPFNIHFDSPSDLMYNGYVYDISVARTHGFVSDGIIVHNCTFHHRGAGGAHTAAASDFEAQKYVLGLIDKS